MSTLLTPFAGLLPPLSTEEFDALKTDIEANGVRDKLLLTEDREILDGHNRYAIDKSAPTHTIKGSGKWTVEQRQAFVIAVALKRRNLSPSQKKYLTEKQKELCKALRGQDVKQWTQARLASMLGVDQATVSRWLDTSNVQSHKPCKKPDARVKLNEEAKDAVVNRVEAGESQAQVAADFGVTQQAVSTVVTAKKKKRKKAAEAAKVTPPRTYPASDKFVHVLGELSGALEMIRQQYGSLPEMLKHDDWDPSESSIVVSWVKSFSHTFTQMEKELK